MQNKVIALQAVITALSHASDIRVCKQIDGLFFYEPTFHYTVANEEEERTEDGGFLWITSLDRSRYEFRAQDNKVVEIDDYGHLIFVDTRGVNRMVSLSHRMETADLLRVMEEFVEE